MRFSSVLTVILVGSLIPVVTRAQRAEQVLPIKNRDLQTELVRMRAEDQRYRNQMQVEIMKMSSLGTIQQSDQLIAIVKKQDGIDKRNMARLEEIIRQLARQKPGWGRGCQRRFPDSSTR